MICVQCEQEFSLSQRERERLALHGLDLPKRCPECRRRKSKSYPVAERRRDSKRHSRRMEDDFE